MQLYVMSEKIHTAYLPPPYDTDCFEYDQYKCIYDCTQNYVDWTSCLKACSKSGCDTTYLVVLSHTAVGTDGSSEFSVKQLNMVKYLVAEAKLNVEFIVPNAFGLLGVFLGISVLNVAEAIWLLCAVKWTWVKKIILMVCSAGALYQCLLITIDHMKYLLSTETTQGTKLLPLPKTLFSICVTMKPFAKPWNEIVKPSLADEFDTLQIARFNSPHLLMLNKNSSFERYVSVRTLSLTMARMWSQQMKNFMSAKDVMGVVDNTWPKPTDEDKDGQRDWVKANYKAMYFLQTSVEENVYEHIEACETAAEIWEKLANVFQKISATDKLAASTAFHTYRFDGSTTMAIHISTVENLAKKLKGFGEAMAESYLVAKLLQGLPDRYASVATGLSFLEEKEHTFKKVSQVLLQEEARQQDTVVSEALSLATSKLSVGQKKFEGQRSGQVKPRQKKALKDIECFHCHKKGHYKSDCRQLKRDTTGSKQEKPEVMMAQYSAMSADVDVAQGPASEYWIADTGATKHCTGHLDWFEDIAEYSGRLRVADNRYAEIVGRGTIKILANVGKGWLETRLVDVYYVPKLKNNLFSVGAATELGYEISVGRKQLLIKKDGKVKAMAKKTANNMYVLEIKVVKPKFNEANMFSEDKVKLWHERLGHINLKYMRDMSKRGLIPELEMPNAPKQDKRPEVRIETGHTPIDDDLSDSDNESLASVDEQVPQSEDEADTSEEPVAAETRKLRDRKLIKAPESNSTATYFLDGKFCFLLRMPEQNFESPMVNRKVINSRVELRFHLHSRHKFCHISAHVDVDDIKQEDERILVFLSSSFEKTYTKTITLPHPYQGACQEYGSGYLTDFKSRSHCIKVCALSRFQIAKPCRHPTNIPLFNDSDTCLVSGDAQPYLDSCRAEKCRWQECVKEKFKLYTRRQWLKAAGIQIDATVSEHEIYQSRDVPLTLLSDTLLMLISTIGFWIGASMLQLLLSTKKFLKLGRAKRSCRKVFKRIGRICLALGFLWNMSIALEKYLAYETLSQAYSQPASLYSPFVLALFRMVRTRCSMDSVCTPKQAADVIAKYSNLSHEVIGAVWSRDLKTAEWFQQSINLSQAIKTYIYSLTLVLTELEPSLYAEIPTADKLSASGSMAVLRVDISATMNVFFSLVDSLEQLEYGSLTANFNFVLFGYNIIYEFEGISVMSLSAPYTDCHDYRKQGLKTQQACYHSCLEKRFIEKYNKSSSVFRPQPIEQLLQLNEAATALAFSFDGNVRCRQLCRKPDCHLKMMTTRQNSFSKHGNTTSITINAQTHETNIKNVPKMIMSEFIMYLGGTFGIWYGLCALDIVGPISYFHRKLFEV
ncbi:Retrovirus-related Pol polyprotein from transposon TNT 1-94 [Halotydeus destructor]|nr:Retrovirus-related Pol polyprotein from transposon TNT 1-94 [Halotydeus destructor]